jgi:hypothetical protein
MRNRRNLDQALSGLRGKEAAGVGPVARRVTRFVLAPAPALARISTTLTSAWRARFAMARFVDCSRTQALIR